MGMKKACVFTVASVKGGTGKTSFALNLAGTFAKFNYKTLNIDLDFYASAVALSLNVDNSKNLFTAIDDMNNNRFSFIDNYITTYSHNIDVLSAPSDPRLASKITINYLGVILRKAKLKYQVIIIDTNHILNEINLLAYDYSDKIIYLINNSPIDLKNIKTMISIHKDMEQDNYKIVLNEATSRKKSYFSNYDIKSIIKNNIDYIIPDGFFIKNIDKYILEGKIPTLDKKIIKQHRKSIKIFNEIATDLIDEIKGED